MTSKRSHTKSRLGCKQCKGRRIRCDQTPPCCVNCAKRGLECEYQEWAELLTPGTFGNAALRVSSSPQSSEKSIDPGAFTLDDLGLLHHFILHTSQTCGALEIPRYHQIWQHEVPKLAVTHPPLMHALLAFAAAHQASADETSIDALKQMRAARQHYSRALVLFRASVKELTSERADVLQCYCTLICFLTLFFEFDKPVDEQDPIGDFVGLLGILHSSVGILQVVGEAVKQTAIGELLSHRWNVQRHAVAPEVCSSLDRLEAAIEQNQGQFGFDVATTACLNDAMINLREVFALTEPRPSSWVHLLSWPIGLGSDFSTLVQERHPAALCMLCHWLVPVYNAPSKWHIGSWPRRLIEAVLSALHGDMAWEPCLAWPRREILAQVDSSVSVWP